MTLFKFALWGLCVFMDGVLATLNFTQKNTFSGILWTFIGMLWIGLICLTACSMA